MSTDHAEPHTVPAATLASAGQLSYAGARGCLVDVLSCVPGDVVLWHSQYWRITEIREPSHGIAAAYGGEVVEFDCYSFQRRVWVPSRITVWPHDGNRWWVDVLSADTVASLFPELSAS